MSTQRLTRRGLLKLLAASALTLTPLWPRPIMAASCCSPAGAGPAQATEEEDIAAHPACLKDIATHPSCLTCGMDRRKFAHSRALLTYADGSVMAACSLHCAMYDMAQQPGRTPATLLVGDYRNRCLLPAREAIWVIGGAKYGVMTPVAKWAFGSREAAEGFVRESGGRISDFQEAEGLAREEVRRLLKDNGTLP